MVTGLIIGLAVLGIGAAIIAFPRTLGEGRDTAPDAVDNGAEYAELYTTAERVRFVAITLGIFGPLMLGAEVWGFPALSDFAERSYCYEWLGVNGTTLLIYGLFTGLPLSAALVIGVPSGLYGIRIIRDEQMPPRGQKVFKRTKIRRGRMAKAGGWARMVPLVFFLGLAGWGEVQAGKLLADFDPAEADRTTCGAKPGRD